MNTRTLFFTAVYAAYTHALQVRQDVVPNPIGRCVISDPIGTVPADLYENTGIVRSGDYAPFTKTLTVRGILLTAGDDVSDAFMTKVGGLIEEIFDRNGAGIDQAKQAEVIRHMYERNTAIPIYRGEENLSDAQLEQLERLEATHSMCDIIKEYDSGNEESQSQLMEVVEHVLHHVTMVGLHYAFYDEWGVSRESEQYTYMEGVLDKYYFFEEYNLEEGDDIDPITKERVKFMEYAYWVISTAWSVQENYG